MPKHYKWLSFGAGFGPDDDEDAIRRFMATCESACAFLDQNVDAREWLDAAKTQGVFLVLHQTAGQQEPDIAPFGKRRDEERKFFVYYDWLTPAHTDPHNGPWRIAAVLMLALATISEELGLPCPPLVNAAL